MSSDPEAPSPKSTHLVDRVFSGLELDAQSVQLLRSLSLLGPVVFVLRNRNRLDGRALQALVRRYELPKVEFVDQLGRWPVRGSRGSQSPAEQRLGEVLGQDDTAAALFLKKPPAWGRPRGQELREGAAQTAALVRYQRHSPRTIHLVPIVFVWSKRPDTLGVGTVDFWFGPRHWPSTLRAVGQLLANREKVAVRLGQPINFRQFLGSVNATGDEALRRRLVYTLLRRLERERRSILGPPGKPPERVRHEILGSPAFNAQLDKLTATRDERSAARKAADQMLAAMQALPDGASHKLLDVLLSRLFQRIYAGLDVDHEGIERLRELARDGTLILLPSHKSYIDFLVVSYAFYASHLPMPLIVAGDNFSFFPVAPIARHAGAFFIRRSFKGDKLYAAVVDAYVKHLLQRGYAIEVFLEGGRSRTGKLLEPKLGLLSMVVNATLDTPERPVYFVPISIGYERIIETAAHQRELSGGEKVQEDASGLIGATRILRHRYGRMNLQFGEPQTVTGIAAELGYSGSLTPKRQRTVVRALADRVMDEINRVTSATPGALTALAVLSHSRSALTQTQLETLSARLYWLLAQRGVRTSPALVDAQRRLRPEALREAAEMFVAAGMLHVESSRRPALGSPIELDRRYSVAPAKRLELDTSKNMLLHFLAPEALLALALPRDPECTSQETEVLATALRWFQLFRHEFRLGSDPSDTAFKALQRLQDYNILRRAPDGTLSLGEGADGWAASRWVRLLRSSVKNFVEAYWVALLALSRFEETAPAEKDAAKEIMALGRRMLGSGELERPEAVTKALAQNALLAFQGLGLIRLEKGSYVVPDGALTDERGGLLRAELQAALAESEII